VGPSSLDDRALHGGRAAPSGRVVAVNHLYAPDHAPTAVLLGDLARHLVATGHEVVVVTSRHAYDDPAARRPAEEVLDGVRVVRVWSSRFGRGWLPGRALDYATFYVAALWALVRHLRPGDLVIAKSDPPLASVLAWLVACLREAELVSWCQDVFPEVAEALGVRLGPLAMPLRALRNASLRAARANIVLCNAMADHLRRQGVPRITVIHNWADGSIRPVPPDRNPLRAAWGLGDRRVIGYAGNLGRAHDVDRLRRFILAMQAADPELVLLFTGGGTGLESLRRWGEGRPNLLFRPYQPRERLAEALSVPDAHIVSLNPACEGLLMPSKLYAALAAGRPVIVVGDPSGAPARLVERHDVGLVWRDGRERDVLALLGRAPAPIRRTFERRFARRLALSAWSSALGAPLPAAEPAPARAA
jgi:colanic acid biosynthesis glycosyl transferase WcaI